MSKNVCSTCKHYERVNDNELEDHGDCTLYPIWVDVWAAHYCGQWASVQKEDALTTGLDIDWSKVPEGFDWVAQDQCGLVWAYEVEPTRGANQWIIKSPYRLTSFQHHIPIHPNSAWHNTLTKRPVATSGT
jgi:hypothetical protein